MEFLNLDSVLSIIVRSLIEGQEETTLLEELRLVAQENKKQNCKADILPMDSSS